MTGQRPATRKTRLVFSLVFAAVYLTGTLGLGWLVGSPFRPVRSILAIAAILAGWTAVTWIKRRRERWKSRPPRTGSDVEN